MSSVDPGPTTFVLVTGAWHGGWCWHPVAQRLRAAGHRVLSPTLPGLAEDSDRTAYSLPDVSDAVAGLIEHEDLHDVVLVGHSWGGYVITGTAALIGDRLRSLVYWSAFVPRTGVPLYDEVPLPYQQLFDAQAAVSGDNSVALPLEVWQQAFMQDAPAPVQEMIHGLTVPQPMQYFTTPVDALPADAGFEIRYVLGADDIALPPDTEWSWIHHAERLGVEPVMVPGSHEACFTRPEELAAALL